MGRKSTYRLNDNEGDKEREREKNEIEWQRDRLK